MKDRKYILKKMKKFKNDYKKYKYLEGFLNGLIFSLIFIIIYIFLIIAKLVIYKEIIIIYLLIFSQIIFIIIAYFKKIPEREIIKKADSKLDLEQRLITYYDYQNKKNKNPFFSSLENELATLLKRISSQPIFKFKWQRYIQITALLLGVIIFLNSYFNISDDSRLRFNSSNNIFFEEEAKEENYNLEKIEFENPLESNLSQENGEEISTIDSDEIDKNKDNELSNNLEENFEKPELDENEEGNLAELEKKLEKIEEEKNIENEKNIEEKTKGENESQNSSYNSENQDRLVENEEKIYDSGETDKNDDNAVEGPGGESSENGQEEEGKEYQAIGENEKSLSNSETFKGESAGDDGGGESDKTGLGAGESEGSFNNEDDFSKSLNVEESERLESQISNNTYLNNYLEEKYSSQNKKEGDNILESYINYRNFLLDSIRSENIPYIYQEMIKDYFIIIKD